MEILSPGYHHPGTITQISSPSPGHHRLGIITPQARRRRYCSGFSEGLEEILCESLREEFAKLCEGVCEGCCARFCEGLYGIAKTKQMDNGIKLI